MQPVGATEVRRRIELAEPADVLDAHVGATRIPQEAIGVVESSMGDRRSDAVGSDKRS
jgi:hypothetical protein